MPVEGAGWVKLGGSSGEGTGSGGGAGSAPGSAPGLRRHRALAALTRVQCPDTRKASRLTGLLGFAEKAVAALRI